MDFGFDFGFNFPYFHQGMSQSGRSTNSSYRGRGGRPHIIQHGLRGLFNQNISGFSQRES
ncbi:hypothetical protein ACS0TY_005557 [Phlomoides rotata]